MTRRSEKNEAVRTMNGISVKQNIVYDDALIPSADEMTRYKDIDPGFVQWFMDNGTREQQARHKEYDNRYKLMRSSIRSNNIFMILLFAAFVIFVFLSAYLIINDKEIMGSVFAASAIIDIASLIWRDHKVNR